MLTSAVKEIVIKTFTEVLTVQKQEEDRMDTLERFDQLFGTSIPDWEQTFIEELTQLEDAEEAIRSVETFISKNQVYDENGILQYNRFRLGSSHHSLTITYDASAPTGHEFSVEEHPDIDNMDLESLRNYYNEIDANLSDHESEEPDDEDSPEHHAWEDELDELESLLEDISERIAELEN